MSGVGVLVSEPLPHTRLITFNRPERLNAMDRACRAEVRQVLHEAAEDRAVHFVVLTGAGNRAFSVGADVKEDGAHESQSIGEYLDEQPSHTEIICDPRIIVVSAVNGHAFGGGLQLALFSDFALCSPNATFSLPQASLGLFPPYGTTARLVRTVGLRRAIDLTMLGTRIDAETAERYGLVNGVVESQADLLPSCLDLVSRMSGQSRDALRVAKEALLSGTSLSLEELASVDRYRFFSLAAGRDAQERHGRVRSSRVTSKGSGA